MLLSTETETKERTRFLGDYIKLGKTELRNRARRYGWERWLTGLGMGFTKAILALHGFFFRVTIAHTKYILRILLGQTTTPVNVASIIVLCTAQNWPAKPACSGLQPKEMLAVAGVYRSSAGEEHGS